MSHALREETSAPGPLPPGAFGTFVLVMARCLGLIDRVLIGAACVALLAGAIVLTESVVVRYVVHATTDWQDETTVFLLVGATFLSASWVQAARGHVGIEALSEVLSPRANRLRLLFADVVSAAFCGFFAWKSWTLFHAAWEDGQVTSSSWGPPLWIPYGSMSAGMSLLTARIVLQILTSLATGRRA